MPGLVPSAGANDNIWPVRVALLAELLLPGAASVKSPVLVPVDVPAKLVAVIMPPAVIAPVDERVPIMLAAEFVTVIVL